MPLPSFWEGFLNYARRSTGVHGGEYPEIAMYTMAPGGSDESGMKEEKALREEFVEWITELGKTRVKREGIRQCGGSHLRACREYR